MWRIVSMVNCGFEIKLAMIIAVMNSQDFEGVWTRDLAISVRRSNQLSYEATDVESWLFVSSNEPARNWCEVI